MSWQKWIPPTAKVKVKLDGNLTTIGTGSPNHIAIRKTFCGAIKVTYDGLSAVTRGRILPTLPYEEDFEEGYDLNHVASDGISFSYPPLPWLGARMRWQVQNLEGERVAGNTLDRVLFQRAINFVGSWKESDYVVEMDAKVDGNRRIKSTIGVINQRYIFALVGNANTLQVVSNYDRFQRSVLFPLKLINGIVLKHRSIFRMMVLAWFGQRPGHEMRQSPKIGPWRKFTPVHTSRVLPVSMPFLRRVKKRCILITLVSTPSPRSPFQNQTNADEIHHFISSYPTH